MAKAKTPENAATNAPMPPANTALAALLRHLREANPRHFQPMNVNFGLFPPLADGRGKRSERHARLSARALVELAPWTAAVGAPEAGAP